MPILRAEPLLVLDDGNVDAMADEKRGLSVRAET
jgi:hypothetical protein